MMIMMRKTMSTRTMVMKLKISKILIVMMTWRLMMMVRDNMWTKS